ncbi:hypothetical protein BgiMline_027450 [Biomphalaria glabrata]|nr:hypothetical protein BgiMline_025231 [Biomphalaria glabrata]
MQVWKTNQKENTKNTEDFLPCSHLVPRFAINFQSQLQVMAHSGTLDITRGNRTALRSQEAIACDLELFSGGSRRDAQLAIVCLRGKTRH